jgi:hypothetical protein
MSKRVALASGGALTAAGILLVAFGIPSSEEPKTMIVVAFVLLGTIMQIYGAWPSRRQHRYGHRYFADDVWMDWREELIKPKAKAELAKPKAKAKAKPKSVVSSRRRRQAPDVDALTLAGSRDASAGR